MIRQMLAVGVLAIGASPALAQGCADITDTVAFCPMDTLWDGLPWHRVQDPEMIVWETSDMALMVTKVPVVFETGPVEVGLADLDEFLNAMEAPAEGAEEIARFPPLGEEVMALARVTRQPEDGTIEYVTLYSIAEAFVSIKTIVHADTLTQDHGLRHEHALRAIVEVES